MKYIDQEEQYLYNRDDQIGFGMFGDVYRGRRIENESLIAVQVISKNTLGDEEIRNKVNEEIKTQTPINVTLNDNPFIFQYQDFSESFNNIYIIYSQMG